MGLLRAPGHRAAPKGASVLSHPGHQSPKEGVRGWRGQLGPHCRPRVAAGPESHTIRKEVSTAQSSQSTKKNPKPGTRRRAGPPQPTQGVPRQIYVQRVLDGGNTREGKQKALTPKPAWGGDPGRSPWEGAGLAGPGGSGRLSDRRRSGRSEHHGAARQDTPAKSTEGRGGGGGLRGHRGRCPFQRGVRRP